ncbi:MAG TPA: VCBS repeat-containing protein, partial [Acidimicrobiales bacterium]|nr:VCBS repeat-containing protein [Acidimicrobiales bacterium]
MDLADVNVDSKLDAVAGGNVWLGNGSGGFGPAIHPSTAGDDNRIVDVNHDPFPDRAGIDSDADVVAVQLGDGTGQFGAVTQYSTGLAPIDLAVADVNGDLFTDLVTANLTGSVTVLLGSEAGTYSTQNFPTSRGPRSLAIGDVNGDTLPDIVVGGFVIQGIGWHTAVLLGDGIGSFGSSTIVSDQLPVHSLQLADLNADGALDVVASADIFYGG